MSNLYVLTNRWPLILVLVVPAFSMDHASAQEVRCWRLVKVDTVADHPPSESDFFADWHRRHTVSRESDGSIKSKVVVAPPSQWAPDPTWQVWADRKEAQYTRFDTRYGWENGVEAK